jgi:hypothetical protein
MRVDPVYAHVHLEIDVDSDPITGTVCATEGDSRPFSGWIELVSAIEEVRSNAGCEETLGWVPGAKGPDGV